MYKKTTKVDTFGDVAPNNWLQQILYIFRILDLFLYNKDNTLSSIMHLKYVTFKHLCVSVLIITYKLFYTTLEILSCGILMEHSSRKWRTYDLKRFLHSLLFLKDSDEILRILYRI